MKPIGTALLIIGFLWIVWDALVGFSVFSYALGIQEWGNAKNSTAITNEAAYAMIRRVSLQLNERHRALIFPAILMFSGGMIAIFGRTKKAQTG